MKKSILLITVLIIVSTLCSCNKNNNNKITSSDSEVKASSSMQGDKTISQNEQSSRFEYANTDSKAETSTSAPSDKPVSQKAQSSHIEYTHTALEGCVITESDRLTGHCVYKTKCPVCGKTNAGSASTYLKSGTLNSGATCGNVQCTNWAKRFDVKIKTTFMLIDD